MGLDLALIELLMPPLRRRVRDGVHSFTAEKPWVMTKIGTAPAAPSGGYSQPLNVTPSALNSTSVRMGPPARRMPADRQRQPRRDGRRRAPAQPLIAAVGFEQSPAVMRVL